MLCLLAMSFAPLAHAWTHGHQHTGGSADTSGCADGGCHDADHHDEPDQPNQPSDQPTDHDPLPGQSHHTCEICIALHTPGGSGLDLADVSFILALTDRSTGRVVLSCPTITSGPVLYTCGPPTLG